MSGNPLAVRRSPGGNSGWEWNFEDDKVRKIAYVIRAMMGIDLFFDDEYVFCIDYDALNILHVWYQNVLD